MIGSGLYRHMRAALLGASLLLLACAGHAQPAAEKHVQNIRYEQLVIDQPQDQSTVFDNTGRVPVRILMSPAQELGPGEQLQLFLDGRPVSLVMDEGWVLQGVERGEHRLQARIVNRDGATIIDSNPVTFFMWQASRNFPNRRR